MAAPKIVQLVAGKLKQLATIGTSSGSGDADKIPATNSDGVLDPTLLNAVDASAGAGDAGKIPQLDSSGRLDSTMLPVGIGADTASLATSENLSAGNLVNVYNNSGTATARKADATTAGKEAHGFVLASTTSPASALVYFEGRITGLSGLTPGARQYLNTTAGGTTETALSGSGNISQCVGTAVSATELNFEPQEPVELV